VVASAQSKDEILAHWWRAVIKMSGVVAFAIAMLAWGGVRMIRQIRIREELEDGCAGRRTERHNQALKALAESDGLTGLANRRLFDETLAARADAGAPQRQPVRTDPGRRRFLQEVQRPLRPRGRRRLPAQGGRRDRGRRAPSRRPGGALRRRGIRGDPAGHRPGGRADGGRGDPRRGGGAGLEHADSPAGKVSLSLGVVAGQAGAEPDGAWVEAADRLLYEAKAGGRDRVAARACLQLHSARSNILP
jgi:GGDEF domain-containing protein